MTVHSMKDLPTVTRDGPYVSSGVVLVLVENNLEREWMLARFIQECRDFYPYDRWEEVGYGTILYPIAWADLPPLDV